MISSESGKGPVEYTMDRRNPVNNDRLKVLVVDDIEMMRDILKTQLADLGHDVVGMVSNGRQAVAIYPRLRPDLVVMDILMPEMDGIEATRKIRELDPMAKVLIVSCLDQQKPMNRALDAGAVSYLLRPYCMRDLSTKISEILERYNVLEEFLSFSL